jgi:tetratricopeptide (TPR) repeat protein
MEFQDTEGRMSFPCLTNEWTPSDGQWDTMKRRSLEKKATVSVLGVNRAAQEKILSRGRISISTSQDNVGAPIFYREVNLPFVDAVKDPSRIRWRFGEISAKERPPVVLEELPVCGNCHSFSADGAVLGMDVDYANDKGSYAITPVSERVALDSQKIITWSDYERHDREPTFGLLSQVSPDGRYVVSTVKDRSVFVPKPDLAFSQLFFPIKGILVVYDRRTKRFRALPGADDRRLVQSNPTWSPDGKNIVFARSEAYRLEGVSAEKVLLTETDCREFLQEGKTFLFDLYRIPFNDGKGGQAEPLKGASHNGMSNYFAKYSPDGKWIVFCKAKSFMLLQPDSQLHIIPAAGGKGRRLRCNTARMNSWHSWSPNGKWLVFSSKAQSPYTQLHLTHIDDAGRSTPAVLLSRFTASDRAANIPEFVNIEPGALKTIRQRFLDDYSYVRAAWQFILDGDYESAIRACRKALEINPKSADALNNLGIALISQGRVEEGKDRLVKAIEYEPNLKEAHLNLAILLSDQQQREEAVAHYRQVLRIDPEHLDARMLLGQQLMEMGEVEGAAEQYAQVVQRAPNHPLAQYHLALALYKQGKPDQAVTHYVGALKRTPDHVGALLGLASIRAMSETPELRNGDQAVALAEKACELTRHEDWQALDVLGAAYAEAGRFPEAISAAYRAMEIARDAGNQPFAESIVRRLELYRQQKPVRYPDSR